ncbi:MAG: CotH kinase family protein [Oligoflexia bacterium]|nr:CotH kinase family protein [Oligoflexia bacterium]
MRAQIFFLIILLSSAAGCTGGALPALDGLRAVELTLSEDSLAHLYLGGREKDSVSALLRTGEDGVPGRLGLSGQSSLRHPKKSFQFDAAANRELPFPFRSMTLSSQMHDPSFLRTHLGREIYAAAGLATPEIEPVVLVLNGETLGLYLVIERVDARFYERRGYEADRIYRSKLLSSSFAEPMVADPSLGMEAVVGPFHDEELRRLARWANSPPSPEALARLEEAVDLESMLRYFAATTFLWNCDGLDNNLRIFHARGREKLFFSPWDWDRGNMPECHLGALLRKNRLLLRLLDYPALRARFHGAIRTLLNEFTPERIDALLGAELARVRSAYLHDRYRGGAGADPDTERQALIDLHLQWRSELEAFLAKTS